MNTPTNPRVLVVNDERLAAEKSKRAQILWLTLFGVIGVVFSSGQNATLVFLSLSVLVVGSLLLWRPSEPPILMFLFGYQWLEASLSTFYANYRGIHIDLSSSTGGNMSLATILSLVGLLALAVGLRLGAGPSRIADILRIRDQAARVSQRKWLYLYVFSYGVALVAVALARAAPGLSQPFLAIAAFKWAAFVAFTYVTFTRKDANKFAWLIVFALELITAIGGYFSSFKFVFIFTFLSLIFAGVRLSFWRSVGLLTCTVLALTAGIFWTAVKSEYRSYLSGGVTAQIVTVNYEERVAYLASLIAVVTPDQLRGASERLVTRIAYVDMFAVAIEYVPLQTSFTEGRLLGSSLARVFMPRILFPNKAIIDESALTNEYTGLNVAGRNEGTQISLGYIGESYVDFGRILMMMPLLLIGVCLGACHRWLLRDGRTAGLVGAALSASILVQAASGIGNSSAKLFGGVIVAILMAWAFKFLVGPSLFVWLDRPDK